MTCLVLLLIVIIKVITMTLSYNNFKKESK